MKEKTNIMNITETITERGICAWISDDDEDIVVVDGDDEDVDGEVDGEDEGVEAELKVMTSSCASSVTNSSTAKQQQQHDRNRVTITQSWSRPTLYCLSLRQPHHKTLLL